MATATSSRSAKNGSKSASSTKKVAFTCNAPPGSRVFVAGSFNNWDASSIPLRSDNGSGVYSAAIPLPKGRHEYKLVVNDQWLLDPKNDACVPNEHGTYNNVVEI